MSTRIKATLCHLPVEQWPEICDKLLAQEDLSADEHVTAQYFLAYGHRQMGHVESALAACEAGLQAATEPLRRAMLLECKAMCLYDMAKVAAIPVLLAEADALELDLSNPKARSVKAHFEVLRGILRSLQNDTQAFTYFTIAEQMFENLPEKENPQERADWVRLTSAVTAMRMRDYTGAVAHAGRVLTDKHRLDARLLQAQAYALQGDMADSQEILQLILTGAYGTWVHHQRARMAFIEAVHCTVTGDLFQATRFMQEAKQEIRLGTVKEYDLIDELNRLRGRLCGVREVT